MCKFASADLNRAPGGCGCNALHSVVEDDSWTLQSTLPVWRSLLNQGTQATVHQNSSGKVECVGVHWTNIPIPGSNREIRKPPTYEGPRRATDTATACTTKPVYPIRFRSFITLSCIKDSCPSYTNTQSSIPRRRVFSALCGQ